MFGLKIIHFLQDLGVDEEMERILSSTSEDIDQVRLFPNGKYEPITLERNFIFLIVKIHP